MENRDNNTGGHIRRTVGYVKIILEEMQRHPSYDKIVTRDYMRNVMEAKDKVMAQYEQDQQ